MCTFVPVFFFKTINSITRTVTTKINKATNLRMTEYACNRNELILFFCCVLV